MWRRPHDGYEPISIPRNIPVNQVQVVRNENAVSVPEEIQRYFEKHLHKKLYADGLVRNGSQGITLNYRFVQYTEGSRLARYMLGGIGNIGESSLTIEVTFFDNQGNFIGKIISEGKISSGVFGGSSNNAIEKAAEEIASYTRDCINASR